MVRPLSFHTAQLAIEFADHTDQEIANMANKNRTAQGQAELGAYGLQNSHLKRSTLPQNLEDYKVDDFRAFRASPSTVSPALAGLPSRQSGTVRQTAAQQPGNLATTSTVSHLASQFAQHEQHNPQDFSGPPLPSGDSVHSQSITSGNAFQYSSSSVGLLAQGTSAAGASAASSSAGGPQRGTARRNARTAPYPGPSSLSSGSNAMTRPGAGGARVAPTLPEHVSLMDQLPQDLRQESRSRIKKFLCHLEQQGGSWSQLVPANSGVRPAGLEQAVNASIRDHGLSSSTRGALNQAFGFVMKAESGLVRLVPTLPEHTALIGGLPQELAKQHHSNINRFLCHLEQQSNSWLQLVPANSGVRPAGLEQAVNASILDHGFHRNLRTSLNKAFGFSLQS
jgi:hypothetical protein